MPEPASVIAGFRWPRLNTSQEVEAINRALAKGILLFTDRAPCATEKQTLRGEIYHTVESVGYAAVRIPSVWQQMGRAVYKTGRHPKWKEAYLAACAEAGELPRTEHYIVDMTNQSCTCQAWCDSDCKYCKHLLGLAYWLNLPHHHAESGLVIWQK